MDSKKLHSSSDPCTSHGNRSQVVTGSSSHIQSSHVLDISNVDDSSTSRSSHVSKALECFFCMFCCIFLGIALGVSLAVVLLTLICILILGLVIMSLLLIVLIIIRLLQIFTHDNGYEKITKIKNLIRSWQYLVVPFIIIPIWVLFPLAKYIPSLKRATVLDLPLTNWIVIISIICGLCPLSFLIYVLAYRTQVMLVKSHSNVAQACSEIIDSLIFWWAEHEVMKRVPSCRKHEILGLPTHKWIKVAVLVLIGHNFITIFVHLIVWSIRRICCCLISQQTNLPNYIKQLFPTKYIEYFANGMKCSISFIMSSLLFLLVWIFYFSSHLNMKSNEAKSIWVLGKWTFLSLLILSFFWLIKAGVLLSWEAHSLYCIFERKIISISEKLYFLGILGRNRHDIFELEWGGTTRRRNFTWIDYLFFPLSEFFQVSGDLSQEKEKKVMKELFLQRKEDLTMDDIQKATEYFLAAKNILSEETYITDILEDFNATKDMRELLRTKFNFKKHLDGEDEPNLAAQSSDQNASGFHVDNSCINILFSWLKNLYIEWRESNWRRRNQPLRSLLGFEESREGSDSEIHSSSSLESFVQKLQEINQGNSSEFSLSNVQTWVVRAHNECTFLANALSSAKEVSSCLNKVMSWILVGATFIMWLLLTKLATTKVLVIIASPLVAATFIFGDTCKKLFEGIIFIFVVHPYDVGDLCVIEEQMMVVKSIGVWRTTFSKVDEFGSQDVVTYPNTELASKMIVNHKSQFDWSDHVECNLDIARIEDRENAINFVINEFRSSVPIGSKDPGRQHEWPIILASFPNVTISRRENAFKLVVSLIYKVEKTEGWTYSECLWKKGELRDIFKIELEKVVGLYRSSLNSQKGKGKELI